MQALQEQFTAFTERFVRLRKEAEKVFIGQTELVEQILICLFCRGHVLLEGLPGLGKTLLVKTLSNILDLKFSRIQCTPDLMPADVIGTNMLIEDSGGIQRFEFQPGPLFGNIILVDEINRTTPKTQSAFLEAMQEQKITVLGKSHALEDPFLLLATQNPIELEGTYPLPEAQLDRFFFKLKIEYPSLEELSRIVDLTTAEETPEIERVLNREELREMSRLARKIKIAEDVKQHALKIVLATHPESPEAVDSVKKYVSYGASPRAAQSMILAAKVKALAAGRYNVSFTDIRDIAVASLRHRVLLNFEGDVARISSDDIIGEILSQIRPK
ncbi:MAG: MoxR family ATPase [Acidobacteria bacterium]|nr:MoxR family ATPase [Acidobacteriota bacterium]